jgi:hypothetical protein
MWIGNFGFVFLTTKSQIRIFTGYGHYWFAKKYADRRTHISKINKVAGGKRHYVIPTGDYSLAVLNRLEIQRLKAGGHIRSSVSIVRLLEDAYYISK